MAYWNNAKHPKTLEQTIKRIYAHSSPNEPKPDVNVDEFLERKRRFEENGGFQNYQNSRIPTPGKHRRPGEKT